MAASSLGLMIGNSRLHWAWFEGDAIQTYDMPHLSTPLVNCLIPQLDFATCDLTWPQRTPPPCLPLWLASVVPTQIAMWQTYSQTRVITLDQIPLTGLYPTLGVDRALALLGAVTLYGSPCLVLDAGTALTLTGANAQGQLVGGAILPGLQLQLQALGNHTAALPQITSQITSQLATQTVQLPERWSRTTETAMLSGVLHSLLAGLQDFVKAWQSQYPDSSILITGGDATFLKELLSQQTPELASQIQLDPQLVFRGMQVVTDKAAPAVDGC